MNLRARWVFVILLLGSTCLFSGCESIEARIKARAEVFNSWDLFTQERIRRGEIKVGDSFDMVLIALGRPNESKTIPVANGDPLTTWTYRKLRERKIMQETVGYRDETEFDIKTGARIHYQVPDRQTVSKPTAERGMMVIFKAGQVSSVKWASSAPSAPATPTTP